MAPRLSIKQWALSLTFLALLLALSVHQFIQVTSHRFELSFLDVGQGDAILIQTPEYRNILIDAGPDGKVIDELSKKLGFFNQKIDLFILTHPDLDHVGGTLDILQKYPVKEVMMTGIGVENQLYGAFIKELKIRGIPIRYPDSSKDIQVGSDLFLDILYPLEGQSLIGQEVRSTNNTSIALMLRDGNKKPLALLTGDAEEAEELDLLLSGQDFESPVFKLGHHGSKTASSALFLSAIRPETVIVSAGLDNKFGHPHAETLNRVKETEILRTTDGTITLKPY